MIKICIIGNSDLGTFFNYIKLFNKKNIEFLIISTKKKKFKKLKNVKFNFISNLNNNKFNTEAYKSIKKFNPRKIVLFYTRKIDKKIFNNYRTYNIHNSLLPYYKGLDAIKKSFKDKNRFICSSSHLVNEKFDSGKIIYQIVTPVKTRNIKFFEKVAFYQRIILLNAIIESKSTKNYTLINDETIISPGLNQKKIKYKFWI